MNSDNNQLYIYNERLESITKDQNVIYHTEIENSFKNYSLDNINTTSVKTIYSMTEKLSLSDAMESHLNYNEKVTKFLFNIFVNQRKTFRYTKAEYENIDDLISDEVFEKIEESCTLNLKKENENNLLEKLNIFHQLMLENAPEELEYMNNDDLSDLFGVSKKSISKMQWQLEKY